MRHYLQLNLICCGGYQNFMHSLVLKIIALLKTNFASRWNQLQLANRFLHAIGSIGIHRSTGPASNLIRGKLEDRRDYEAVEIVAGAATGRALLERAEKRQLLR